jgi:2-desacetyl-2-hydroxyethyl bacteriochlorophyllide A dehydrogenase
MGYAVRFTGPRAIDLHAYKERPLAASDVRLRTLYSGISAGTQLTAYRGSNPYLSKRWDPERHLFMDGAATFEYPVEGCWAYEEVGEVVEVGGDVTKVAVGDVVWGTWGHRSTTVMSEADAADRVLAPGVDPVLGIFSQIGAIALNVVLDADIHVGETVAVFGQGPPGLIAGQLARLNGGTVIAVDAIPRRLEVAKATGAAYIVNAGECSAAEEIKALTDDRGADVSLEISGKYPALHEAIRATTYSARVIAAGFFQGEGNGLALGEEFHHNRVQVICSQIFGVAPQLSYRWNERRLRRTVMSLVAEGRLDLVPLISHTIPARQAAEAFDLLDRRPEQAVQVVLDFQEV